MATGTAYRPVGHPLNRAIAAYYTRGDWTISHCGYHSGLVTLEGKDFAVLRDEHGEVLAAYRVRNDGTLKRLRRWPKGLEGQK